MRVDVPMSYPASPHAVVAMLVDRAYQERKCAALDARHVRITIHPDSATPTVVADRVSRVAGPHCCGPAPSEPCWRVIPAHGSSKP